MTIEVATGGASKVAARTFHFACFGNFSGRQEEGPLERYPMHQSSWEETLAKLKPQARATLAFEGLPDIHLHWTVETLGDFRVKGMRKKVPFLSALYQLIEDVSGASPSSPVNLSSTDRVLSDLLKTLADQSQSEEFVDLLNMVDLGDDSGPEYGHLKKLIAVNPYIGEQRDKVKSDLTRLSTEIHRQINASASFRDLQATWRGLHTVVKYFGDNVKLHLTDCMRDELCDAFFLLYVRPENGDDPPPLDLAFSSFQFDHSQPSITALHHLGRMAESLTVPLVQNAAPTLIGAKSHGQVTHVRDLANKLSGPEHIKWRALREESGADWLFLAVNPFATGENSAGSPIWSAPAYHFAAALADRCQKGRWPGELLAAQGVMDLSDRCAASIKDQLANDLAFEGLSVIDTVKDALGVKSMNSLGRIILSGPDHLDAGHLVPYTLAYRFYAGACSRYFLGPFAENGDMEAFATFAGLENTDAIQTEQADDQRIIKFEAPFAIFGQKPELAMAMDSHDP